MYIIKEKASLLVDVRRLKTPLLKLPNLFAFALGLLLSQVTGDDRYMKYLEKGALSLVGIE